MSCKNLSSNGYRKLRKLNRDDKNASCDILNNDFSNGDAEGADNDKNVGWTQYESLQDVVDGYNQGNGNPISIIGIKDE